MQTLGWAVVHSLWVCTLVAGVAVLALAIVPDRRARLRYLVACAGLLLMVGGSTTVAITRVDLLGNPARWSLIESLDGTIGLQAVVGWRARTVRAAAIVWLVLVALRIASIAAECRRVRRLARVALSDAGDGVRAAVEGLRPVLRVAGPVGVYRAGLAAVPMVIGWRRPRILLPATAVERLSRDQLGALLAHELAHVRRRDYAANLAQTMAEALLVHHPAAWWMSRRVRTEREYCCDDAAIRAGHRPLDYARALATLDEARHDARLVVAAASGTLLDRIQRLAGYPRPRITIRRAALLLVLATIAAGLMVSLVMTVPPGVPLDVRLRSMRPQPAGSTVVQPAGPSLPRQPYR
jgi:beta-lactamase regulating signal transducer with metallopeptidase domain